MTRTYITLVSLLLCTNLYFSLAQVICGGTACATADACCDDLSSGYRCYNSHRYTCAANELGESVLCSLGFSACGTTCYNASQFTCETGELLCGNYGGRSIKACGAACYDPTLYGCCDNELYQVESIPSHCAPSTGNISQFLSGPGPLFCGASNIIPCQAGQWCCDGVCYDPTTQVCFDYQICPAGNLGCGYDPVACFDPNTQECCNNQVFAYGSSVCSEPSATCCSCLCDASPSVGVTPDNFTLSSADQCTNAYVTSEFGMSCPDFLGYEGNFGCAVSAQAECPFQGSSPYESGHNVTLVDFEGTQYEEVPADYAGEVCCWCGSVSEESATSAPVPNVASCNAAFLAANQYFTPSDAQCRIWSTSHFALDGLACGLPSN